ncbi:MAG: ubiquinone/menaquinone biosynthesis methyltransferase [Fibrobacterales bacterium]
MSPVVKNMFDGISTYYDVMNRILTAGRDVRWRKKAVRLIKADTPLTVLDLCGGTGDFMEKCSEHIEIGARVLGDFSFNMLSHAQKKEQSRAVQLDALNLPLKSGMFDLVLNGFGMRNLDDLSLGLTEIHRVLKDEGEFLTLEFFKPSHCFPKVFYRYVAPVVLPLPSLLFKKDAPAYKYLVNSIHAFVTVEEYTKQCQAHGFIVKSVVPCDGGIAHIVYLQKGSNER